MTSLDAAFLSSSRDIFQKQKRLAERAMEQLSEEQLFETIDPEANSIAVIVKHLHGNMRSRWTDFLTTDGEKPDRGRDNEFLAPGSRSRAQVMQGWADGWGYLFAALDALAPNDLTRTVTIRQQPLTAADAILRQLDHYGQHVGQIVLLAKHAKGAAWQTLSIPRGKSEEYLRNPPAR